MFFVTYDNQVIARFKRICSLLGSTRQTKFVGVKSVLLSSENFKIYLLSTISDWSLLTFVFNFLMAN